MQGRGEDFKGREKAIKSGSDTGSGVTERAEVPQDLVNIRSSWFMKGTWRDGRSPK